MPKNVGGYVMVDLSPYEINIITGASTPITVSKEIVEKLKQFEKPVLITHFDFTIDGGNAEYMGYTQHSVTAGVHMHNCNLFNINVSGDTQITINLA